MQAGVLGRDRHGILKNAVLRQSMQLVLMILMAFASYLLISNFFLQSVRVIGLSMAPNLNDSERYLLNKWIYYVRTPKPAEIVVIRDPADHGFSVKRVVATGGDLVEIRNGKVFVNGSLLSEPYLPSDTPTFPVSATPQYGCIRCKANQIYVLGDNRMNSVDSRNYGPVLLSDVRGLIVN